MGSCLKCVLYNLMWNIRFALPMYAAWSFVLEKVKSSFKRGEPDLELIGLHKLKNTYKLYSHRQLPQVLTELHSSASSTNTSTYKIYTSRHE